MERPSTSNQEMTFNDPNSLNQRNAQSAASTYKPLADNEIRLLNLHPGRGNEPIICSLITVPKDTSLVYEALSYVWGSQQDPVVITLDNKEHSVTQNLYQALLHLRTEEERLLWIDALVINQSDLQERASQVLNMVNVYSDAKTTIIWLGHGDERIAQMFANIKLWSDTRTPLDLTIDELETVAEVYILISKLSYWRRVWVVQECAHSSDLQLVYGSTMLPHKSFQAPWQEVSNMIDYIANVSDEQPRISDFARRWVHACLDIEQSSTFELATAAQKLRRMNMRAWISWQCSKLCLDPRDLVFGYINCMPRKVGRRIAIDYTKPTRDVFIEATMAFLEGANDLQVLGWVEARDRHGSFAASLPSWVPNLEGRIIRAGTTAFYPDFKKRPKEPGDKNDGLNHGFFCQRIPNSAMLHVKGAIIGHVGAVSATYLEQDEFTVGLEHVYESIMQHFDQSATLLNVTEDERARFECAFLAEIWQEREGWPYEAANEIHQLLIAKEPRSAPAPEDELSMKSLYTYHKGKPMFRFINRSLPESATPGHGHTHETKSLSSEAPGGLYLEDEFGIGTGGMEEGDQICAVFGCSAPLILRQVGGHYVLVGSAYLDGFKWGPHIHTETEKVMPYEVQDFFIR